MDSEHKKTAPGGAVFVVGLGPGDPESLTPRADRALRECGLIVGYSGYTGPLRPRYPDKEYSSTGMTGEADRFRVALDRAAAGERVALVCSGDPEIYGMAGLLLQLRGSAAVPAVEVIPGITAACSGGALLGAPLGCDFCTVSLSDRLTPWETIAARLSAAAAGDFVIVLYNPASRGRPEHLRRACEVLLRVLPPDRPCGLVRNVGREGERCRLLTLAELREAAADMFCTAFVGSSATLRLGNALVTPRGYRGL